MMKLATEDGRQADALIHAELPRESISAPPGLEQLEQSFLSQLGSLEAALTLANQAPNHSRGDVIGMLQKTVDLLQHSHEQRSSILDMHEIPDIAKTFHLLVNLAAMVPRENLAELPGFMQASLPPDLSKQAPAVFAALEQILPTLTELEKLIEARMPDSLEVKIVVRGMTSDVLELEKKLIGKTMSEIAAAQALAADEHDWNTITGPNKKIVRFLPPAGSGYGTVNPPKASALREEEFTDNEE
jgi:hypothetical protein